MAVSGDPRWDARRRLRTQKRRANLLRSRVIAISAIAFVLLWGVVFVQMATGNDPVLGSSSAATKRRSRERPAPAETEPQPVEEASREEAFEAELEAAELEAAEEELAEVEVEPAPVTSSQS